jgi:hypothetical protein
MNLEWISPFQPDAASDWWNFGVAAAAAVGTIAATWVAVVTSRGAVRRESDALLRAGESEEKLEWIRMAAQASRVRHKARYGKFVGADAHLDVVVRVFNRSDDPIFDVELLPEPPLGYPYGQPYPTVDNNDEPLPRTLEAGSEGELTVSVWATQGMDSLPRPQPTLSVSFTDFRGVAWLRTSSGELITPPPPAIGQVT